MFSQKMLKILTIFLYLLVGVVKSIPPLQEHLPDFGAPLENAHNHVVMSKDRLPTSINPFHYRLELRPILEGGTGTGDEFTVPGKLWVTGVALGAVQSITLNTVDIQIVRESLSVTDADSNVQLIVENGVDDKVKQFYTVSLTSSLTINRNYTLYIEFLSKIYPSTVGAGLYVSHYKAADGSMKNVVSTDFEAPDARMAFPCFDEPHFKAEWEIEIIRQSHYHSLSNMNILSSVPVPELPGWVKDTYARTVKMSSYLVCLAISDFTSEVANSTLYSKPVAVWGPPEQISKGNGNFAPDFSAKIMKFFEEYYGIEYSLPKMDKISIPDYSSGAMENWGLNTYRDTRLLYEEGVSTAQDMFSMTNTISHELVHQWWGNLVTCEWWSDLWIQEGAATYYAPVGVVGIGMGDLMPMETLIAASVQRSLEFDGTLAYTHPIHNVDVDPSGSVLFDTLTYHKGASLIRMMNAFLTTPLYNHAMTTFLNRFSYGNANQFQLFEVLDEVLAESPIVTLPASVSEIMYNWTMASGYPVITVDRDSLTNTATFTQKRFYQGIPERDDTLWYVPISIFRQTDTSTSTRPEKWIPSTQISTTITPIRGDWFIVNPQTHGYYRVRYATSLLDPIIAQLMTNHTVFDAQVRSSLVDDNLNLAYAGYLPLSKALELTLYLKMETELFPWQSFFTNMALPYRIFSRSSGFPYFKKYILSLTDHALNNVIKYEPQDTDTNPTILLRTRLVEWRCNMGDSDCISFAKSKISLWMDNPSNTSLVQPDLQPGVYCTAIANGGDLEWHFLWGQYLQAGRDVMQTNLLRALACSKTSFRLNTLMEMALDRNSGILDKHRAIAMQAVAGNSGGVDIAFNFLRNNYETMIRRYGSSIVNSVVTTLTTQFNNGFDRGDLTTFMTTAGLSFSTTMNENMDKNIAWASSHLQEFIRFAQGI